MMIRVLVWCVCMLAWCSPSMGQAHVASRVEIAWNRYYTYEQIMEHMRAIERAYPELVTLEVIGSSGEGRDIVLAIVNNDATGAHETKPAMWIDGNVHANEVQAAEVVLYTLWYLTKAHGENERLTELLDTTAFYLVPVVNPDSRVAWFETPTTPHFHRRNLRPVDQDLDGAFDEDGFDDLDGDGHITGMWRPDPNGDFVRSQTDPRVFERVDADETGSWSFAGWEGIDNDGDGRINEDPPGGDDMNRNWPGGWKPGYVQGGAGEFPFSNPETRAIGEFIVAHRNIAAVQSYHNTGGMILRGPGAAHRAEMYPPEDRRVYDALADEGVRMLPYYRSLVIHEDLYTVHGGFVTWTSENLGLISYTNELWTVEKYFQGTPGRPLRDDVWLWRDRLAFGELFTDYTEVDHPTYGRVLVGGPNKWSSRSTPTFMLEEECHRNFAFTMFHAEQMPRLSIPRVEVERVGDRGVWAVTFEVRNATLIPTRTAQARAKEIGRPDLLEIEGSRVVASGRLSSWFDDTLDAVDRAPGRVLVPEGIGSRGGVVFRAIVAGDAGASVTIRYTSDTGGVVEREVVLRGD